MRSVAQIISCSFSRSNSSFILRVAEFFQNIESGAAILQVGKSLQYRSNLCRHHNVVFAFLSCCTSRQASRTGAVDKFDACLLALGG